MDEQKPPAREDARVKHTDETQETFNKRFAPMRLVVWAIAILFLATGIIWLGYAVGLLAALFPGGPGLFEGWIWGMVGVAGLILVIVLLRQAQN